MALKCPETLVLQWISVSVLPQIHLNIVLPTKCQFSTGLMRSKQSLLYNRNGVVHHVHMQNVQQNDELFYIKATNFTLCELLLLFIVLELTEV